VFTTVILWPWLTGLVVLALGLITARRELSAGPAMDRIVALGGVFAGSSLALFSAEHFTSAKFIMQMVPEYMPFRLFWAWFVGFALLAAGLSLALKRYDGLAALCTAILMLLLVLMIHAPLVHANPRERIPWIVALRECSFASGFLAYAGSKLRGSAWMTTAGRIIFALIMLFFAVENFLHPLSAPGVPLEKVIPAWFPLRPVWAYISGLILLAGGAGLLLNRRARQSAAAIGAWAAILTFFLYLPVWIEIMLHGSSNVPAMAEGMNYVGDTLLFAGAALLLSAGLSLYTPPRTEYR
jgi:uncharacterized membrane protein